jgi:ribonuclease R
MILRARRFAKGALELDLPEVQIDFDKNGTVTGAHQSVHDESHQIIEEFMLAANIAVATEFADRGLPFLRRVHGDPDLLKLERFAEFVKALGFSLKNPQSRPELQKLLARVKDQPVERAVNYALLRSMKQAEYTAAEFGHYALAAENYCHFTSPIRRYPDLTIHRLFDMVLASGERPRHADQTELMKLGKHCSITERRAAAAERELTKVKLLMYMSSRIGEELDAVITGVEHFGIFCQGVEIPVEGMIHISALPRDDFYDHDQQSISLIGRRTGKEYRLGDAIRVVVALVDVDRRVLDFRIADGTSRPARSAKRRPAETDRARGARAEEATRSHSGNRRRRDENSAGHTGRGERKKRAKSTGTRPKGRRKVNGRKRRKR